ncbi:protein containg VCBS repeat [Longilinea arvoryzae]|uniref:Protein containg VCBS repeat n=1 Tax=Longilinea arvoryzae TaxID=360412 RepID=A0A0S7BDE7_9CHLR|nr:Ig-like domain-containing protein [Longilinea arvoryzae]GAP12358.1 protein containg VCBS repeat [Longilinea arvoryzae]
MTNPSNFKLINLGLTLIIALGCVFSGITPVQAAAQGLSNTYTQSFDGLRASGSGAWVNDSTLPGWYASRNQITADNGSSGAGGMFSYGSTASAERAFGALPKKNTGGTIYKGLLLQNDTLNEITRLYVAFTGEQWRNSAGGTQILAFSYQVGASAITSLTAGAWTSLTSLDFSAPVTSGTAGALNGNLPANQRRRTAQFSVAIPAGSYIMLRWTDADEQGADHGLAIDDLVVSRYDPPQAAADAYQTSEDTPLTIAAPGLLANDTAHQGQPLSAVLVDQPSHGAVVLNADGSFTYTPTADWNGSDSFTYTAKEAGLASAPAAVTLTISPVNDAPRAAADGGTTDEDVPLVQPAPGVLDNDSDADGDALTTALVDGPSHGSLTLNSDGSYTYTPNADWNGTDNFTYTAFDGVVNSSVATVTLTVNPAADAPRTTPDSYDVDEDALLSIAAPGLLENDTDADGDNLTAVWVSDPLHGVLALNADGSYTYQPDANWNGDDSFTYQASDGFLLSAVEAVTLHVQPINDAPTAIEDGYSTPEDTQLNVNAPGVLGNDTDRDGDGLSAHLVTDASHGDLTLNADGSFSYQPDSDWNGDDSFTYAAHDAESTSGTVTVELTVNPVNDAPTATADTYSLVENGSLSIPANGVLANDIDVDGDVLTAVLDSSTSHGSLTLNTDGSFSYTPAADWNGSDSFTYHANDGAASSETVTVTLTVDPDNTAPYRIAPLPDQNHPARTPYSFDTSAYFGDSDTGDVLTFSAQLVDGNPLPPWLSCNTASGVLSGTPPLAAIGVYSIRVTASDGSATVSDDFDLTVEDNPYRLFIPMVLR